MVARAASAGVGHVIVVSDSLPGTERALALADEPGLSATAGVHPHEAASWSGETPSRIRALAVDPRVVAVGETGLDYHYDHAPRPVQRRAFEEQLALAAEVRKPVVVHAREADDDVAAIVTEWGGRVPAIVLHSFSSGPHLFDAGMNIGAYFGWSGMVTFRNWTLTDRLTACPPDRLLLETDAPYLAPVPHRGKRNEPAFVHEVFRRVAELRGEPAEQVAACTTANAERCFGARLTLPNTPRA